MKNAGSSSLASSDEAREGGVIETQHRLDHRPRGERKNAEREQVENELIGSDGTHTAVAYGGANLSRDGVEDASRQLLDRHAGERGDELLDARGIVGELGDDVAGQYGCWRRTSSSIATTRSTLVSRSSSEARVAMTGGISFDAARAKTAAASRSFVRK